MHQTDGIQNGSIINLDAGRFLSLDTIYMKMYQDYNGTSITKSSV